MGKKNEFVPGEESFGGRRRWRSRARICMITSCCRLLPIFLTAQLTRLPCASNSAMMSAAQAGFPSRADCVIVGGGISGLVRESLLPCLCLSLALDGEVPCSLGCSRSHLVCISVSKTD